MKTGTNLEAELDKLFNQTLEEHARDCGFDNAAALRSFLSPETLDSMRRHFDAAFLKALRMRSQSH